MELLREDELSGWLWLGMAVQFCWLAKGFQDGHQGGQPAHMPVQLPLGGQGGQTSCEALQDVAVLTLKSGMTPLFHALSIQQVCLQSITATSSRKVGAVDRSIKLQPCV